MADNETEIRVNRAPVLTLGAIVAEHLGFNSDAATTLGRAVAGSGARIEARPFGLEEDHKDCDEHGAAKRATSITPR